MEGREKLHHNRKRENTKKGRSIWSGPFKLLKKFLYLFTDAFHLSLIHHIGSLRIDRSSDSCPKTNDASKCFVQERHLFLA